MKVDFLIVGAQKSGTTALNRYLRTNDDIEMARTKELHFFDNEYNFINNVDYSKYHSSFENSRKETLKGESTPAYMYWYAAPRRIWEYNPRMKLIVVLRNPIDRAFSHWNMQRDRNADNLSFSEAIRIEKQRCRETLPLQHYRHSYTDRGFYTEQIRRLWHFFPKEQVLILKYEELKSDISNTLQKISSFLEVKGFTEIQYENVHARKYATQMEEADRLYLESLYSNEIINLERILDWDCSDWIDR
jgi:hypothetical protein